MRVYIKRDNFISKFYIRLLIPIYDNKEDAQWEMTMESMSNRHRFDIDSIVISHWAYTYVYLPLYTNLTYIITYITVYR